MNQTPIAHNLILLYLTLHSPHYYCHYYYFKPHRWPSYSLHPGPMNRGVEIDSELADDLDRSAIFEQVQMGVAVRMACLKTIVENKFNNEN